MDRAQAIYQEPSFDELFEGKISVVSLHRNFRNTKQIGQFAHDTVFGNDMTAEGRAKDADRPQQANTLGRRSRASSVGRHLGRASCLHRGGD